MIGKIRKFIPHWLINYGKHLPQALIANIKYGFPGKKLRVIGVTGTDGKTTTVNMIYQILKDAGKSVSMISTINAVIAGKSYDTGFHVTSPDPKDIQNFLRKALDNGDEFIVLEVTSHALEQFRVWGIPFEIGVVTNITHEHLDYHKTFENYIKAKLKLIKDAKLAVVNQTVREIVGDREDMDGRWLTFGLNKGNFDQDKVKLKLKIPGDYNLENALAAFTAVKTLGIDENITRKSLENFEGLPGRMEEIKNNKGIKIIVDFAHTPNALEQALTTLRTLTKGKLISVFGCAGARDVQKRPLMGEVSSRLADITVLTDEDPRFENSKQIMLEIIQGMDSKEIKEGQNLFKEPDRAKAIKLALSLAKKGDAIGIFGKGHEKSMSYQGKEIPWSDQQAVYSILKHGR